MAMRILPAFLMSSSASACASDMAATKAAMASAIEATIFSTLPPPVCLFSWCSLTSYFLAFGIHDRELGYPTPEFLGGRERRAQIGRDQILGEPGTYDLRTDAHDVDVVVLDTLVCGVDVMAHRSPNSLHLVRADRGADTGAAHHEAALHLARRDGSRDLAGD